MIQKCRICLKSKPVELFQFRKDTNKYRTDCFDCVKKRNDHYYRTKRGEYIKRNREYYLKNKDIVLENQKLYHLKNREKRNKRNLEFQRKNPEGHRQRCKKYRENNKKMVCFQTRKRQTEQLKRTPNWVNLEEIKNFYIRCPKSMTVDHIIPLQNKNVSGLNVVWNLQYLSLKENSSKHNKFDFTYENNSWRKNV